MTQPTPTPQSSTYAKTWVAAIGGILATLVPILHSAAGWLPYPWNAIIVGFIALLTAVGVYHAPK